MTASSGWTCVATCRCNNKIQQNARRCNKGAWFQSRISPSVTCTNITWVAHVVDIMRSVMMSHLSIYKQNVKGRWCCFFRPWEDAFEVCFVAKTENKSIVIYIYICEKFLCLFWASAFTSLVNDQAKTIGEIHVNAKFWLAMGLQKAGKFAASESLSKNLHDPTCFFK